MAAHPVIRRRRRRRAQAGFTLIEVMIAVLLTAIATSGIIGLYTVETRASGVSRRYTEATVLGQDQLERLRTEAAPAVASLPVTGTETNLNALGTTPGPFSRNWTVSMPAHNLFYEISVTVSWTEDGVARNVTLRGRRNLQ